jgi:hypothetical protein
MRAKTVFTYDNVAGVTFFLQVFPPSFAEEISNKKTVLHFFIPGKGKAITVIGHVGP